VNAHLGKAFAALTRFITPVSRSRNAKQQMQAGVHYFPLVGTNWDLISDLMRLKE
jgi:hypothetical protein